MSEDNGMMDEDETGTDKSETGDAPLIDLNDASLKKLIARAKKRGYITYDELNEALPQDQMSSDQIEDIMSALSEMGVNIVENDEDAARRRRSPPSDEAEESPPRTAMADPPSRSSKRKRRPSIAPTIRCACICARWARSSCSAARARSRSPSASRPAATR